MILDAVGSQPERWTAFGADGRRGALNFIDEEKVRSAARLVRTGEVFSLNSRLDAEKVPVGRPPLKRSARMHNIVRSVGDGTYVVFNDDVVEFALQGGSHLDAFSHFGLIEPGHEGIYYGGAGLEETSGAPSAKTLGIEAFGGAIVTRGVLVDVVGAVADADARFLDDDFQITSDVIELCLERQGIGLERGDAVLIFTGYEDRLRLSDGETPELVPGIDATTLQIWEHSEIAILASDNLAVEPYPVVGYTIHIGALRNLGIPLGELWLLRDLVERCRGDGVYEFLLTSAPLNIHGAFGSPANAVAIR